MNIKVLKRLLEDIRCGRKEIHEALETLKALPFEELGFATVDTHRSIRAGFPEVIFGEGKSSGEIAAIAKTLVRRKENVFVTRLDAKKASALKKRFPRAVYNKFARTLFIKTHPVEKKGRGDIAVVCAGTSDISVAEEAAVTAEVMGNRVRKIYDVGVAGIHRVIYKKDILFSAGVIVAVAGMEGALPGVVAGISGRPVIAVPTSVGYGANLGGFSPLLTMLNSCASGVVVVNIDNGFGAGYAAALINRG
jgi:NCAIR mutase (PurE)-related protein